MDLRKLLLTASTAPPCSIWPANSQHLSEIRSGLLFPAFMSNSSQVLLLSASPPCSLVLEKALIKGYPLYSVLVHLRNGGTGGKMVREQLDKVSLSFLRMRRRSDVLVLSSEAPGSLQRPSAWSVPPLLSIYISFVSSISSPL